MMPSIEFGKALTREMLLQRLGRVEQLDAQALAGPVVLKDDGIAELASGGGNMVRADDGNGRGCLDPEFGERLVLRHFRHFKLQGTFAIDDAAAMPRQPGEHRRGVLRCEAMSAGVRGRTHAIVENAVRRLQR